MSIQIDTSGGIRIDNHDTGLGLAQRQHGTVIFTRECGFSGVKYAEHKMPHARYSAAHDAPNSGAAGRAQLEADVRVLLERLK